MAELDIFGEKRYEELDCLTKAIEPITWSLLETIAALPDEYIVPNDTILKGVKLSGANYWLSFNGNFLFMCNSVKIDMSDIPYNDAEFIYDCYKFVVSPDFQVRVRDNEVIGSVKLIKVKSNLSEKELIVKLARTNLQSNLRADHPTAIDRTREILDLIGTERAKKAKNKRTSRVLESGLRSALYEVMSNNKWNIRDIDLAQRMCNWIVGYIQSGNLAAMRNFCLLKAATHRGYPIYSIDEEPV